MTVRTCLFMRASIATSLRRANCPRFIVSRMFFCRYRIYPDLQHWAKPNDAENGSERVLENCNTEILQSIIRKSRGACNAPLRGLSRIQELPTMRALAGSWS